jgi:hypothetical protein
LGKVVIIEVYSAICKIILNTFFDKTGGICKEFVSERTANPTSILISLLTHISNRFLKHVIEGKIEGRIEVTGRRGRRCRELLDHFKERRGYCKLKEEALDRTLWRTRFGRGCGPNVRQTTLWMKPKYTREYILLELDSEGEGSSAYYMRILNTILYLFFCVILS